MLTHTGTLLMAVGAPLACQRTSAPAHASARAALTCRRIALDVKPQHAKLDAVPVQRGVQCSHLRRRRLSSAGKRVPAKGQRVSALDRPWMFPTVKDSRSRHEHVNISKSSPPKSRNRACSRGVVDSVAAPCSHDGEGPPSGVHASRRGIGHRLRHVYAGHCYERHRERSEQQRSEGAATSGAAHSPSVSCGKGVARPPQKGCEMRQRR